MKTNDELFESFLDEIRKRNRIVIKHEVDHTKEDREIWIKKRGTKTYTKRRQKVALIVIIFSI